MSTILINFKNIFMTFLKYLLIISFTISTVVTMAFHYNDNSFYPILFIVIIFAVIGYFIPKMLRKKFGNTLDKVDRFNYMKKMGTIYTKKDSSGLYPYRKYLFTLNRVKEIESKVYYINEKTRRKINFLDFFVTVFGLGCLVLITNKSYNSYSSSIIVSSSLIALLCIFLFLISKFLRNFIIEKNFIKTKDGK